MTLAKLLILLARRAAVFIPQSSLNLSGMDVT
jgi:hypothetical protein